MLPYLFHENDSSTGLKQRREAQVATLSHPWSAASWKLWVFEALSMRG